MERGSENRKQRRRRCGLAETGHLDDPRCRPALDLLEQKRLPDGGWPAEGRYYSVSEDIKLNADYVNWGGISKRKMNP